MPRRVLPGIALAAGLLAGCADALPNSPNGPTPPPQQVLRSLSDRPASLEQVGGVRVLFTRGTPYEEGFQQGSLLADELHQLLSEYVRGRLVPAWWLWPPLAHGWVARQLASVLREDERELVRGLAAGAALSQDEVLRLQAEPPQVFARSWRGASLSPGAGSLAFWAHGPGGEAVLAGSMSGRDEGLRHRFALLHVAHPRGGVAYVTPAFAGQALVAWQGLNARGVAIAGVQVPVSTMHPDGVPPGVVGRRVLLHATTLAEAEQLVRKQPSCSGGLVLLVAQGQAARRLELAQTLRDAWKDWRRQAGLAPGQPPDVPGSMGAVRAFAAHRTRAVGLLPEGEPARAARLRELLARHAGRVDVTRAVEVLTTSAAPGALCLSGVASERMAEAGHATFQGMAIDLQRRVARVGLGRPVLDSPALYRELDLAALLAATATVPVLPGRAASASASASARP